MNIKYWLYNYSINYLGYKKIRYIYDLELLISKIFKIKINNIILLENKIISLKKFIILEKFLHMLKNKIPLSYVLKNVEFYSIFFKINNKVFIPRYDTESIIDFIINTLNKNNNYKILDIGSGIGNISIPLAINFFNSNIIGIDINKNAIKLAKINSINLKLKNINFLNISWFKYIPNNKFDLIISNPPYISINEFNNINNINKIYEPKNSLVSNYNSIYNIFYIINKFSKFINKNGLIILEHGYNQVNKIKKILKNNNFYNIKTFNDLNNIKRFTTAVK